MSFATHPSSEISGLPLSVGRVRRRAAPVGNHFLVQHHPDEFVVTVGQVTAPPLVSPSDRTGGQSELPIQTLTPSD